MIPVVLMFVAESTKWEHPKLSLRQYDDQNPGSRCMYL